MVGTSKNPVPDLDEPSIGRIRARDIAPPRSVGIIKRAIAKAEQIELSRINDLFLLAGANGEAAEDKMRLDILDERGRGPGGSPEVPIAIVLGQEVDDVASVAMSHTEPGRVINHDRPKGWKHGKTTSAGGAIYLCLAIKPRGGLRWLDGTLDSGKALYMDPSGLVNLTDGGRSYSMYPVILHSTRDYGFMPAGSIELDPEPKSVSKGKFPSFKLFS